MNTLLIVIHLYIPPAPLNWEGSRPWWGRGQDFSIVERPMPSMENCEHVVAGIPKDKGDLVYCINIGTGYY